MIRSFKSKAVQRLYLSGHAKGIKPAHVARILVRLERLDVCVSLDELPQEWKCHSLSGNFNGYFAISINAQWRLVFRFEEGDAFDVDYVQYH